MLNKSRAPEKAADDDLHTVLEVIDGDTLAIEDSKKVRLLSIDAPERGSCYYQESREALRALIGENPVRLEKDISNVDKYGRLLRYAIIPVEGGDNILVNEYLVREGFAVESGKSPDNRYERFFMSAEEEARENKRGLWGACEIEEGDEAELREIDAEPPSPDCIIKGNISEKGYGMTYLVPGCDNYNRVKIDLRKGEKYFCSEEEAVKAGFRKATNCP